MNYFEVPPDVLESREAKVLICERQSWIRPIQAASSIDANRSGNAHENQEVNEPATP